MEFCSLSDSINGQQQTVEAKAHLKPGDADLPQGPFRNHIGLNEGLKWSTYILDRCKEMGIKILRKDLGWSEVEKKKGEYDWTEMDKYLQGCEERGIRVMFILGKTNGLYDRTATIPIPGNYLWEPYANYVKAAVERYKGRKVIWELWNEPNVPHMPWDMTPFQFISNAFGVFKTIRSVDPNATIVGPANGYCMRFSEDNWCWQVLRLMTIDKKPYTRYRINNFWANLNAWTGHHYTTSAPDDLNIDGVEMYELQRKVLDAFGGHEIPYCTGERGFTSNPIPSQYYAFVGNEKRKTAYYTRQCLWGIYKEPRGFTINYVTYDVYNSGKEIVDNATGVAIKSMLDVLGDFEYKERIDLFDDKIVLLRFVKGSEERFAIWDRTNQEKEVNVPVESNKALVYTNEGSSTTATGTRNSILLRVGEAPLYIVPLKD
jgi:hypothetical protein